MMGSQNITWDPTNETVYHTYEMYVVAIPLNRFLFGPSMLMLAYKIYKDAGCKERMQRKGVFDPKAITMWMFVLGSVSWGILFMLGSAMYYPWGTTGNTVSLILSTVGLCSYSTSASCTLIWMRMVLLRTTQLQLGILKSSMNTFKLPIITLSTMWVFPICLFFVLTISGTIDNLLDFLRAQMLFMATPSLYSILLYRMYGMSLVSVLQSQADGMKSEQSQSIYDAQTMTDEQVAMLENLALKIQKQNRTILTCIAFWVPMCLVQVFTKLFDINEYTIFFLAWQTPINFIMYSRNVYKFLKEDRKVRKKNGGTSDLKTKNGNTGSKMRGSRTANAVVPESALDQQ